MTNIFVAALVALVVSLGTEWFFKPGLEARKEYKLEQHRATRAMVNMARDYVWKLEQHLINADNPSKLTDFRSEFIKVRSTVDLPREREQREAIAVLTQIMEGSGLQDPSMHHSVLLAAIKVIETPHWKRKKRRAAVEEFHKRVVGTSRIGGSQSYPVGPNNQISRK